MKIKSTNVLTVMLALCCIGVNAQRQTAPAGRKTSQVLNDFRIDRPNKPVRLYPETQRNVLSKMFRRYFTDDSKCNRNFQGRADDPLKAARNAGQIVPTIEDMATGSFTAMGQTETAYVVAVNECNASHAENFGTKRVGIFSGTRLVADLDVDFRSSIVKKSDLNGDGVDELLMTTSDMAQGTAIENAALLSFENGRVHVIQDLGTVFEDSCSAEMPDSAAQASVISVMNAPLGNMPKLRIDNYKAGCGKGRRWRFVSTGKMN